MLRDSVVVVAVFLRTRLRTLPLAMITMRKSTHGFPFVSHVRSSAINPRLHDLVLGRQLPCRRSAHSPVIHAASHFYHEKRVA